MKTQFFIGMLRAAAYRLVVAVLRLCVRPKGRVPYRVTILKLDRLGDAVLSLGVVRRMVAHVGPGQALLVVSDIAEPLYRMEFPDTDMLVLPAFCERFWPDFAATLIQNAAALRETRTEHLVCLRHQPSDYLHAIAQLLVPRHCHASCWEKPWERLCLSYPSARFTPYPTGSDDLCQELEAHRLVAGSFLNTSLDASEVLPSLISVQPAPGEALLVCPTAGSPLREYPAPLLAQAIRQVRAERPGLPVVFCLPPAADPAPWANALREEGVADVGWSRPGNVRELVQVIAGARVVLAPESAPAHLATALDKPGVFCLGGGHFGLFAPWRKSQRQIWPSHALDCYHCRWRCIHAEALCLTRIAPAAVARAVLQLLSAETQHRPPV